MRIINNNEITLNQQLQNKIQLKQQNKCSTITTKSILKPTFQQDPVQTELSKQERQRQKRRSKKIKKQVILLQQKLKQEKNKPRCQVCQKMLQNQQNAQQISKFCENCKPKCKKCNICLEENSISQYCQPCKYDIIKNNKKIKFKICVCGKEFQVVVFMQNKCDDCRKQIYHQDTVKQQEEQNCKIDLQVENQDINSYFRIQLDVKQLENNSLKLLNPQKYQNEQKYIKQLAHKHNNSVNSENCGLLSQRKKLSFIQQYNISQNDQQKEINKKPTKSVKISDTLDIRFIKYEHYIEKEKLLQQQQEQNQQQQEKQEINQQICNNNKNIQSILRLIELKKQCQQNNVMNNYQQVKLNSSIQYKLYKHDKIINNNINNNDKFQQYKNSMQIFFKKVFIKTTHVNN